MKKLAFLLLVALIALIISTSAYAFVIPMGEWNAHFSDFSSVYHNGVGQPAGYIPVAGDYIKSVVNLEQVIPKGSGLEVWHASAHDQVAGFEYNFEFLGLIGVAGSGSEKTYWGPVTVPQSRIDLYARDPFVWNTGAGFAPRTGPEAVDLNNAPSIVGLIAGINDAGSSLLIGMHLLLHPDQTFPGATLVLTGNILTGTTSGDAYAVADSGSFLPQIDHQILGPAQIPSDFYLKFSSNLNQPLYGWSVRSEDPAEFSTITPTPCIELIKEVSNDGLTWHDANDPQCSDAPGTLDPAFYRLTIKNCGTEELTNLVINDPVLGITNYAVGSNLPVGGPDIVLTSAQIAQLNNPNLCPVDPNNPNVVNGGLRNIARVDAEGITSGIDVFDEDPACIKCVCIDLIKEVSNDGVIWHDANDPQCSDAPGTLDPAHYRLRIKNCGGEELTDIVINDPVLGITNFPVGSNLPAGGPDIVLTSADIGQLSNPNLCPLDPDNPNLVNGGLRNIARVDAEGISSGIDVFDEDPACIKCVCIDLIKEVSNDGLTWHDANDPQCADAPGTLDPAYYRLRIKNCGGEELTDIVINDPVLGITNFPVGSNLPAGGPDIVLTSADIGQLSNPNLCPLDPDNPNLVNGGLRNIARVDAEGVTSGIDVFDEDPACIKCGECCLEIVKTATPEELTCVQGLWWLSNRCKCCITIGCIQKCCTVPKVTYTYKIKNLCDPVTNVKVVDNKFGTIATFAYLGTGEERTITRKKCLCKTTTNTATVKGYLVSDPDTFCEDSDFATVKVIKPW